MNKAFFLQTSCCLLLLSSFIASSQGAPQRVRTSGAPILIPAHTSDIGYIEITGRSVWVPVANIGRNLQVGQLKPMLQRNQDFYIGLYLYDDGYAELFAVPRILPDGSGSAWVTQEHEIMFGSRTETRAGRFFFTPTELLPLIDENENEFVVTCERHNRSFPLRIAKQTAGIRRVDVLPDLVSRAMETNRQHLLLASSRSSKEPSLQAQVEPSRPGLYPRGSPRLEDPDFVNPYPEPVLEVRRNQTTHLEDPFLPMEVATAATPRPAPRASVPSPPTLDRASSEEAAMDQSGNTLPLPPLAPRVVRRHVIENLSSDLRVEFQASMSGEPEEETVEAAPKPALKPRPTLELNVGPSIEFQTASAAPSEAEAPRPTVPQPEQAASEEDAIEPEPATEIARAPSPFQEPSLSAEPEPPVQIAAAGEAAPVDPKAAVEPAPPVITDGSAPTSLSPETPDKGQEPEEPAEMLAKLDEAPPVAEDASTLMTLAVNLLIFFALLTALFVVVVIALALFLNRRKSKTANAALPPGLPQPLGPPPQKKSATAAAAKPHASTLAGKELPIPEEPQIDTFSESLDDEFEQPGADVDSGTFTGSLESFSVAELIQFLNSSRETGMLSIDPDDDDITCKLYFERGEIVDALSSRHTGEKAVADILSMRDGLFSFTRQQEVETHRTVRQSTMSLLLQVQPYDESSPLSVP